MWNAAGSDRRPLQIVGLALLLLTTTGLSGCLGDLEPPAAAPVTPSDLQAQPRPEVSVAPVSDPEVLRIQGDQTLDRLAARTGWAGTGTLADPYVIADLQLHGRTLVLQDLSRMVVLEGADLRGPDDGPALIVWNVTGLRIADSTLHATGGPALALLEARWCSVQGNTLHSDEEAIQASASEALDLIDNDLHARTTAIRAGQDGGDHWIEDNRIHQATRGIVLDGGARPSLILGNVIEAETGIVVRDAPGPILEDNRLEGRDGIRLDAAHGALLLNTTIEGTGVGLAVGSTDDWIAEGLRIDGGTGLELTGGRLAVIANLSYDGPGPAVMAEGGDTIVLVTPHILLNDGEGDGILFRGTRSPVVLDGRMHLGERALVMEATTEASVIGTHIIGTTGPAIVADRTEATVVAESLFEGVAAGVRVDGGGDHQVAENRFVSPIHWSIQVQGVRDTYVGHNVAEAGQDGSIVATASSGTYVEANHFNKTGRGIQVVGDRDTVIRGNVLTSTSGGIEVVDQRPDGKPLLIEGNELTSNRIDTSGVTLDNVSGFILRTNALMTRTGLVLRDVAHGQIFNNWFDNTFNVAASGNMEALHWSIAEEPGQNIAGGEVLAGNWWNGYYGTDADEDGIGDIPYVMLPYEESLDRVEVPNAHVEDEAPLVADETVPGLPTALPAPQSVEERLASLLGLHPRLDAFVAPRI